MEYMTVSEVAATLRASDQTVRRWCKSGKLQSTRVGGRILIPRESVMALQPDDSDVAK